MSLHYSSSGQIFILGRMVSSVTGLINDERHYYNPYQYDIEDNLHSLKYDLFGFLLRLQCYFCLDILLNPRT